MYYEDRHEKKLGYPYKDEIDSADCNTTDIFEQFDVSVPVSVEPFVEVGNVTVDIIDEPCVTPIPCKHWNRNGICKFLVSQRVCVQVPITFKAKAKVNNNLSTDCCESNDEYPVQSYPY